MIQIKDFSYQPHEDEAEKASNAYLMSLVALLAGLPIPIVNLIATLLFWLNNLKASPFVKWHCTQAFLSQITVFLMNSAGMTWALTILFGNNTVNNNFIAYLITIFIFNLMEFVGTLVAAIYTRKGKHVEWMVFGTIADKIQHK